MSGAAMTFECADAESILQHKLYTPLFDTEAPMSVPRQQPADNIFKCLRKTMTVVEGHGDIAHHHV